MSLNESHGEKAALTWFGGLGYASVRGPRIVPGELAAELDSFATGHDFGPPTRISAPSSPNLTASSPNSAPSSPNLSEARDKNGCLPLEQLTLPVIDDLAKLSPRLRAVLEEIAGVPRRKKKVDREVLIEVVLRLCTGRFVTLRCLAELVNRKPETLRDQYLSKLVRERKLALAFPTTPNHERQAYCSKVSLPP